MEKLLDFLNKLDENNVHYRLNKVRDSIMVEVAIPGERWEIEFFTNGNVEVEKFISQGIILDESALNDLDI
ncbi:MAG: hypothetical protein IJO29_02260 [Oscillospiraceae bacterium]|nr:hypothetical protein [Oscillospiraceae bacterium]